MDELSDVCALLGTSGNKGELDWDQLPCLADHRTTHALLSNARVGWKVMGSVRPLVAKPVPGAVAACATRATLVVIPQNPNHKPDIARLQLLECHYGGTTIHPCMAELDKKVPKDMPLPEGAKPIHPRGAKPAD